MSKIVSVFGSARLSPGENEYEDGIEVGRLIAEAGWTVATGGYRGIMEAACRGAAEAGGHTIGATVSGWDGRAPNRWVKEERPGVDLFDRLRILVAQSDAMVAVAGGVGTLAEVTVAWNMMQHIVRDSGEPRPVLLVGPRWAALDDAFGSHLVDAEQDRALLEVVSDPRACVERLRAAFV